MKNWKSYILSALLIPCFTGVQLMAQSSASYTGEIVKFEETQLWMQNHDLQSAEEIRGHLYGQKALMQLLEQPGVTEVKIYNAQDSEGSFKLVFQGLGEQATEVGLAYDVSKACPPICGGGGVVIEDIGAPVSYADAQMMISEFALNYPESPNSYTFSAELVAAVLTQPQSKGLFLAYGVDEGANPQLILLGISSAGQVLETGPVAARPRVGYSKMLSVRK